MISIAKQQDSKAPPIDTPTSIPNPPLLLPVTAPELGDGLEAP